MPPVDPLARDIRLYIYRQFIECAAAPSPAHAAQALQCTEGEAEAAFRALADARAIVLRPGTTTVWMAMPFSNVQTPFTVISGGRAYYANCACDAFGIAVVLGADACIFTTCPDCGGVLQRKIARGDLSDARGVVHVARPARDWWKDIGASCSTILLFGSEEHVDRWCARESMARGAVVSLEQIWQLAKLWYRDRLDPGWRRPTPAEAAAAFASVGLHGEFWSFDPSPVG